MEDRSRETTPTKEDLDFIVDDGYKHDEDPDYVPNEKYVVTGPEFKRLTRNAKKLGAEHLIIQPEKIINIWPHFQVERKFTLGHQNIQTTLFTKIKSEEINIGLELLRLKTNREN